jgi:hypothetical protein
MEIDWKALAEAIPREHIRKLEKTSKKTGKTAYIDYITARVVMNRLDKVLGPPNWYDTYNVLPDGSIMCTLFLRINGEWIGKADVGTESDIEGEKGAFSVALKRAAVKWGIGRELYRDGTAFDDDPTPPRPATAAPRTPPVKPAPKAEPEPEDAEAVKAATPAAQTREDRRIGAEDAGAKRRNLRTKEIEALKTFIKAISPEIQAEKGLTAEFHAAGSILKAMKLDDWKQLTIAEDNEAEELAAIRAQVQQYVETEHVAPDDKITRELVPPVALPPAVNQ